MTAVILEFKRTVNNATKGSTILCVECGRAAAHRIELIGVDMNHSFVGYKYFCDNCFPQDAQAGE